LVVYYKVFAQTVNMNAEGEREAKTFGRAATA